MGKESLMFPIVLSQWLGTVLLITPVHLENLYIYMIPIDKAYIFLNCLF